MASFSLDSIALPSDTADEQFQHVSTLFNKIQPSETLRISDEAVTPLWLTKKLYTKLVIEDEECA